jgi:hypothetical protein
VCSIHAFPAARPEAVALVDVEGREVTTYIGGEIAVATQRLMEYEIVGAVNVRPLLRTLGVDAGDRRLAELGPPQKTWQLNRRGRTLKITTELLVQGSCGITRPFGDDGTMREYLRSGAESRFRRRLEADAKSLYALYHYGRVHGVRAPSVGLPRRDAARAVGASRRVDAARPVEGGLRPRRGARGRRRRRARVGRPLVARSASHSSSRTAGTGRRCSWTIEGTRSRVEVQLARLPRVRGSHGVSRLRPCQPWAQGVGRCRLRCHMWPHVAILGL